MFNRHTRHTFQLLALSTTISAASCAAAAPSAKNRAANVVSPQPPQAKAAFDNPHVWQTHATSVAVFKNGLGFFIREGKVALRDGWCLAEQVPPATFGTLAIYSLDADELVDVIGSGPGEVIEFDG